jgi:hypothetical protein
MMDTSKLLLSAAAALCLLAQPLFAKPISVTVTLTDDSDFPGFVTKADDKAVFISPYDNGTAAAGYPHSRIKNISWREPDDWKAAIEFWNRRDYAQAIPGFAKAMEDYKSIATLEDSIGAQAVFYYMECLRRTGKFSAMMEPYLRVQKVKLGKKWQDQIRLFQGWAHLAGGKWKPLFLMMQDYEVKEADIPGIGEYTVAPNELPLQDSLNVHHMAQIAYLRGISVDKLSDEFAAQLEELDPRAEDTREEREKLIRDIALMRSKALTDYSRAFTINYGAERGLALRSMLGAMGLLKKDTTFAENYAMQKEAHGIAVLFDGLTNGKLPATHKALLTPPVEPEAEKEGGI